MEKKIVRVRLRIKETHLADVRREKAVLLCERIVYGVQLDPRTIRVENYEFHAGRKAGFGKSAYIYSRINNRHCTITIDPIEEVA